MTVTGKNQWRIGLAATTVLLLVGMVALDGCHPVKTSAAPVPQWLHQPLAAPAPNPAAAAATPVAPLPTTVANPATVFDPQSIVAVLDEPALAKVKADVAREAYQGAANKLAVLLRDLPTHAPQAARWQYQLARLRLQAGDPVNAAAAFDRASAHDWPLADYARLQTAQLLTRMDQPAEALVRLQAITMVGPVDDDVTLASAAAYAKLHDVASASAIWRSYLARTPRPKRWVDVALRFVRTLLHHPSIEHAEEAVTVARLVMFQSPGGRGADEARALEEQALLTIPSTRRKPFKHPKLDELATRARSLADARQGRYAVATSEKVIDRLAQQPGAAPTIGCNAHLAHSKGLGLLRRYTKASQAADQAIAACHGLDDQVIALFLGGRYALRAGEHAIARKRYQQLEKTFPSHRFADDARLHGAEAALALGDKAAFTTMLSNIAEVYPDGDMVDDALFTLARSRIEANDWAGALRPLEKAVARKQRGRPYYAEGRPHYFLARTRAELGQSGAEEAMAEVIRQFPLSYYMVLAYARLSRSHPALARRTLDEAQSKEPHGNFVIADHPSLHEAAFVRASELVRQGDGARALAELNSLGVRTRSANPSLLWASAFLLARISAPSESHRVLRSNTNLWREHYPAGVWRRVWEVAYPQPYKAIVARQSKRFGLPEHLAYGIMREESAFKPRVVSRAGAYGLMQLILPTARDVGKRINVRPTKASLKRPAINIQLGVRFLSQLSKRFPQNPLLAIPGYNAGPGAPTRWLKERPEQDFDIWVERIPYRETRHYTKRVIQSMAAYAMLYGQGMASPLMVPPIKALP